MSKYFNSAYASLEPYVPGEQPRGRKFVKLNTNESPYAPGKKVLEAINEEAIKNQCLYEDPTNYLLNKTLAEHYHVDVKNVMATAGSDEAINLAFMAFGEPGVQFPDLTYGFYKVYANLHHFKTRVVPVKEDFTIDINEYKNNDMTIVFANPNAPTGLLLGLDAIREILEANPDHVVIVDEAYIDFGGQSAIPLIKEYNNLVVIQTMSKSRSLAGARVGYAIACEELIADMETVRNSLNPYDTTMLSQLAGIAAVEEQEYYDENCKKIMASRAWTTEELRKLGFTLNDSYTNFVFAKTERIGGEALYLALREKGILVRHFNGERVKDYIRVTIGSQSDMEQFIAAVKEILG